MQNRTLKSILFLAFAALIQTALQGQAFFPALDSTFNSFGYIYLNDNYQFIPQENKLMADGKFLVGGYGRKLATNMTTDGILYRINQDGTLDTSFGTNGQITIDIDGTYDAIEGIDETSDHKVLVLLSSFDRTILVRYLNNGTPDPDFGNEGILQTDASTLEYPYDLLIQPDQKIVVCGLEYGPNNINKGIVRRFNPDGSSDESFGTNGLVRCDIDATKNLELYKMALQPDGKIVATGPYGAGSSSGFPVIRLNTDGTFDNTFSSDGKYVKVMGNSTRPANAWCITVKPDGKILVGGNAPTTQESAMAVVQVKPDGNTDTNFGSFGACKIVVTWFNSVYSMAVQPDGKVILGGYCFYNDSTTVNLSTRITTNGIQDITYGPSDGYFATLNSTDGYNLDLISSLTLLDNGKMLQMGWTNKTINLNYSQPAYCSVFRYRTDIAVGTDEPNPVFHAIELFPSPVRNEQITMRYELDETRDVTLTVYDAFGKELGTLINGETRNAGQQQEQFYLPASLPAGNYFLELSTYDGRKTVQIVKY